MSAPAPASAPTAPEHAYFLPTLRELARCYQAFEQYSSAHIRALGLTPPQFDVIATLGNTAGMSCRELGAMTLTTKGTLTGILDRLEDRGLLRRVDADADRRSFRVELTRKGQQLFEKVFPAQLAHLQPAFDRIGAGALTEIEAGLARLRQAFEAASAEIRQ